MPGPTVISGPIFDTPPITGDTSVEDILNSPQLFEKLLRFTEREFSSENPRFLMVVRHYRALANHQSFNVPIVAIRAKAWIPPEARGGANTMGKYIYDNFIAEGCATQVNLPAEQFTELNRIGVMRGTPFIPPSYDAAYKTISALISRDTQMRLIAANAG